MKSIFNSGKGFTLLELLAVMVVVIVVGTILGSIIFSSLRVTRKTNALISVRQNGNYALTQVSKMIRDAKILNSPYPCVLPPAPTPTPSYSSITITSLDDKQTTFGCNLSTSPRTIASNTASLLDTSSVYLYSCQFTCKQRSTTDTPTIVINFGLSQAGIGGVFSERRANVQFKTTVQMRGLNR